MKQSQPFQSWRPFWTLLKKEVLRFFAVASQTLAAPLVTASLYLLIFGVSLGSKIPPFHSGVTYLQFVIPGLVLMGVINNAFANISSSLFMSRYLGNIVDILVTPISSAQFIMAYTLAAMLRGLLVGTVIMLVSSFFTSLPWAHPLAAVGMMVLSSFMFSQFGILAAIYSVNFDTLSMYTNFLILPLVYLGGLFYPVSDLPSPWAQLSQFNPIYYLIAGFRTAILGVAEIPLELAFGVAGGIALVLFVWAATLVTSGYKLRV
ncbi:MAG: ABC transporter permease [Bdellovibrionales bacterium]|nr:ABC transporter permease [Bdellovibrionales bacterium]